MSNVDDPFVHERGFLTLGGSETYLLFLQGFALQDFCAFELFDDAQAFADFEQGFLRPTADAALEHGMGLVLDCLVWRASPDWVVRRGHALAELGAINTNAVARMRDFAERWRSDRGEAAADLPIRLIGEIGPRGDGYALDPGARLDVEQAAAYHRPQIEALASAGVHAIGALTMTSVEEAVGIVRTAAELGMPVFASPTVETDGTLPDGSTLGEFIERVDEATDAAPLMYQVNCAHPTHLAPTLHAASGVRPRWLSRIQAFRANASRLSHAELDESETLDAGDAVDLAARVAKMREDFDLRIVGGCCGTDATHMAAIASACHGG
ncbi:MAG: homocysteine S-methyltransferase family protein [Myxococcota bacterium]